MALLYHFDQLHQSLISSTSLNFFCNVGIVCGIFYRVRIVLANPKIMTQHQPHIPRDLCHHDTVPHHARLSTLYTKSQMSHSIASYGKKIILHNDPLVPFTAHCNQFKAEMRILSLPYCGYIVTQRARATHSKRVNCIHRRDRGKWTIYQSKPNIVLFLRTPICQLLSMIFHRFVEWLLYGWRRLMNAELAKRYKCIIINAIIITCIWVVRREIDEKHFMS